MKEKNDFNSAARNPPDILSVSENGGLSSLLGVITLIGKYSGKVIDTNVRTSYCEKCEKWKNKEETLMFSTWYESHKDIFSANHESSAGKMEVGSVVEMFVRSQERYGMWYGFYIGDGDSLTFKTLLHVPRYGYELTIQKLECVLHVKKKSFQTFK